MVKSVDEPPTAPPAGLRILRGGGSTARVRPWPDEPERAHLIVTEPGPGLVTVILRSWMRELASLGFRSVRTGALRPAQRSPYDTLGFGVAQELALLQLDLQRRTAMVPAHPAPAGVRIRRGRMTDAEFLGLLDTRAFPTGWGLDEPGVLDAVRATPHHRISVAVRAGQSIGDGMALGFAISGRGGRAAYLQRLAVAPEARAIGVGALLVDDGIRWAKRWRAHTVTVNTQSDNHAALGLYQRAGYQLQSTQLVVMERSLDELP